MRREINRREFCQCVFAVAGTCLASKVFAAPVYRGKIDPTKPITSLPRKRDVTYTKARYYRTVGNRVQCILCPEYCMLKDGEVGYCRVRLNRGRKLYSTVYGAPCSIALHPIEQGPIFHAYPGARCLAIATAGCNLRCRYCQNWQMSQFSAHETQNYDMPPESAVKLAIKEDCDAMVFTYTEPIVFAEYAIDVAIEARKNGLKTVMVTAGYIDPEPMKEFCSYFDVVRVDLKGFTDKFYEKIIGGKLQPILMALEAAHQTKAWVEVVTLLVPNYNDSEEEISGMSEWIVEHLSDEVPLHLMRFFPAYKMRNFPPTPETTLLATHKAARRAGLKYVYIENWPDERNMAQHTYCPKCKKRIVTRVSYLAVTENRIVDGKCEFCEEPIAGKWG